MQEVSRIFSYLSFVFRLFALILVLIIGVGCNDEPTVPSDGSSIGHLRLSKTNDTSECSTSSAILQINQDLDLFSRSSQVRYRAGSVLLPTLVSFSICDVNPSGTFLTSKIAVFGPSSLLPLLNPMEVKVDAVDAGLPANTQSGTYFRLYRRNELSGGWDFVLLDRTHGRTIEYQIIQCGEYAIGLAAIAVDTTWRATGVIPPTGGSINLLSSRIVFPPGSVADSTLVSFSITEATPVGLPGATNRIYDFGPDGTTFLVPIVLYVSFTDAGLEGDKISPLRFYYCNPSGTWIRQPTVVDRTNRQFVVTLSHFSRYAFGR